MLLVHTSFLFMTVVVRAFRSRKRATHHIFLGLSCTSMMYHSNHPGVIGTLWRVADQAMIVGTIGHNLWMFPQVSLMGKTVMCLHGWITQHLFFHGKKHQKYCFDNDPMCAQRWHSVIHILVTTNAHITLLP